MQIGGDKQRVKLMKSLREYDKRCKKGEEGYTMPDVRIGFFGVSDRFVAVKFDNGAKLDILWKDLEILNQNVTSIS